jgi:hypothetical protein
MDVTISQISGDNPWTQDLNCGDTQTQTGIDLVDSTVTNDQQIFAVPLP